jgi:hypothetical protein
MKAKWFIRGAALALIVVMAGSLYYDWHNWNANKGFRRFQAEFGFPLPADSRIVFSNTTTAWDGGGEALYVYQLNDEAIATLVQQGEQAGWSALPFPVEQLTLLQERIPVHAGAMAHNLPYALTKGLGIAIERHPNSGRMTVADPLPYANFTLGLIDPDTNRVYCYAYDS